MAEENGTGSNLIWAITTIIIVAIIAGALYYSGFLGGTKKEKIDINVDVPATKSNQTHLKFFRRLILFLSKIKRLRNLKFDFLFAVTVCLGNFVYLGAVFDFFDGSL